MGGGNIKSSLSHNIFEKITSLDNLFLAWKEFKKGKMKKEDVLAFNFSLEESIFELHDNLKNKIYKHNFYHSFYVCDPKLRFINKASVSDRIVHQAVFRVLYHIFDKSFIYNSCSCRFNKGVHFGVKRLENILKNLSQNNSKIVYVLKCDIKKFFSSINKNILLKIIKRKIKDKDTLWLIKIILDSFDFRNTKGLPLGNVTSQLFANIYLNELDQFVKHKLKIKYYLRYTDDFLIISKDKNYLFDNLKEIKSFLEEKLELETHPFKIVFKKYNQGIDFLGYVCLPYHKILRTKTRKRILKKFQRKVVDYRNRKISEDFLKQSLQSYLGVLSHCNSQKLFMKLKSIFKASVYGDIDFLKK